MIGGMRPFMLKKGCMCVCMDVCVCVAGGLLIAEESLSELDVEDPGTTTAPLSSSACDITATSVDGATSSRRQQRANKRMARQAQLKR